MRLIHRSAWNRDSRKFKFVSTEFSEAVRHSGVFGKQRFAFSFTLF